MQWVVWGRDLMLFLYQHVKQVCWESFSTAWKSKDHLYDNYQKWSPDTSTHRILNCRFTSCLGLMRQNTFLCNKLYEINDLQRGRLNKSSLKSRWATPSVLKNVAWGGWSIDSQGPQFYHGWKDPQFRLQGYTARDMITQ